MYIWKLKKKNEFYNQQKIWNSKTWLNIIKKRIQKNIKNIKSKEAIKVKTFCAESPVPLLVINKRKKIKILDFGSGSLEMPLKLMYDTNINIKIEFYLIESKKILSEYKKALSKIKVPKNFSFKIYTQIDFNKKYDIFHISDSMQYVNDWKNFLKKIKVNSPELIVFNNLTAGQNPTYDAFQNFYNSSVPYRFYNINDIIKKLRPYKIIYKSNFLNKIKNKYKEYPQKNFSKKMRLGYPCTLIFKR